jgi:hypothetical protein
MHILDVPPPPTNLRSAELNPTSVILLFEPPFEESDACPVEYYVVERKTARSGRWREAARVRPSGERKALRHLVDELFADEIYVFRVFAVNEVGRSEASNAIDVMTPEDDRK